MTTCLGGTGSISIVAGISMMYDAFVLETSKSVGIILLWYHTFDSLHSLTLVMPN